MLCEMFQLVNMIGEPQGMV